MTRISEAILAPLLFHGLRGLETLLPPDLLYRVLLPAATLLAWSECCRWFVARQTGGSGSAHVRQSWRTRRAFHLNRLLEFFSDRLHQPRWASRCVISGLEPVQAAHAAGRPVVLAFCHFGPFILTGRWLRARGMTITTLVEGEAPSASVLAALKQRIYPRREVPNTTHTHELRAAAELLRNAVILAVALDIPSQKPITVRLGDGTTYHVASGAIRMAAGADALLAAYAIVDIGRWRFEIRFGPPVALPTSIDGEAAKTASIQLVEFFAPFFNAHRDQWYPELHAWMPSSDPAQAHDRPGLRTASWRASPRDRHTG